MSNVYRVFSSIVYVRETVTLFVGFQVGITNLPKDILPLSTHKAKIENLFFIFSYKKSQLVNTTVLIFNTSG